MYLYGYDPAYMLVLVISMVLGFGTQAYINSTYKKWSKVRGSFGATGAQVAKRMLDTNGAPTVGITRVSGHLTDYYDPRDNNLHLSDENFQAGSVASVAVACHEAGHAVQNACGYFPMKFRAALVPVVNFTQQTWGLLFMLGIFLILAGFVRLAIALYAFIWARRAPGWTRRARARSSPQPRSRTSPRRSSRSSSSCTLSAARGGTSDGVGLGGGSRTGRYAGCDAKPQRRHIRLRNGICIE